MKNFISQLEKDIKEWQEQINSQLPIVCSHQICPQCQAEIENRNKENEILMARINDRITIINLLKI